ncbi:hypothetical protein V8E53_007049 [Lactarius tabidus]
MYLTIVRRKDTAFFKPVRKFLFAAKIALLRVNGVSAIVMQVIEEKFGLKVQLSQFIKWNEGNVSGRSQDLTVHIARKKERGQDYLWGHRLLEELLAFGNDDGFDWNPGKTRKNVLKLACAWPSSSPYNCNLLYDLSQK